MKFKYSFEPVELGDEVICVPVGTNANEVHGVLKTNKEGLEILSLLQKETTEDEVISVISKKYENGYNIISEYVRSFLAKLRVLNLLSE